MENVYVKSYIYSKPELKFMPFMIVYKTIMSLVDDGLLNLNDFQKDDFNV